MIEAGWIRWAIVLVASLILFFVNLGGPKLWDRDEPRNAACAHEMMQAGDWVVPRFNDELRAHKPVLTYWLMITAYQLFGVNEFSARFFSAVLGVLTVLLTYSIGQRLLNREAAFWGALALASSLMFVVASRAATPDAPLIFTVTLAMWVYCRFSFPTHDTEGQAGSETGLAQYYPSAWWQVGLLYAAMGLAVLAKGPVGLILPTAIIGMFLLIQRLPGTTTINTSWGGWLLGSLRPFMPLHFLKTVVFMRPLLAIGACLAVSLPWYVWVAARDFRFVEGFLWEHNFHRATTAMEGHAGPPYYYLVAICIGFFPWSIFFGPFVVDMVRGMRNRESSLDRAAVTFLLCWVAVWMVAFSIAQTKLPSYVTPVYPALALLMGLFVSRQMSGETAGSRVWLYWAHGVTCAVGLGILVIMPTVARRYLPGEPWLGLIGLLLVMGGGAALVLLVQRRTAASFGLHAVTGAAFSLALFSVAAQRVSDHHHIDRFLAEIRQATPQADLHSWGVLEASWVYYAGSPIRFIPSDVIPERSESPLGQTIVLTTGKHWNGLNPQERQGWDEVARDRYFLREDDLIALRPRSEVKQIADRRK